MIQPKIETEHLLLSITKNCATLIEQTHRKAEETLEFKIIKPRETFHFNPPIHFEREWIIGLTSLEIYNSIFNIREENIKFELYRDSSNKFGFLELKDELEEILNISHITQEHLEDEKKDLVLLMNLLNCQLKRKIVMVILLLGYDRSQFRDFESYLRIVVALDEEDVQLILKQYNSHFITYELTPGIYTIQDISDAVHTFSGHNEIIEME